MKAPNRRQVRDLENAILTIETCTQILVEELNGTAEETAIYLTNRLREHVAQLRKDWEAI